MRMSRHSAATPRGGQRPLATATLEPVGLDRRIAGSTASDPRPSVAGTVPHVLLAERPEVKRTVDLTEEQIAVVRAALDCWERAIRDSSHDPQVQEWARTHPSDPGRTSAAIREALERSSPAG